TTVVLGAAMLGLLAGGLALLFGVAMLHDGAGLAGPGVAAVLGGGGLLLLAGVAIRRNAQKLIGEEVRIGADGVTAPGAGRGRFVPYARIERVLKTPRGVQLRVRDGGVVDVPASAVDIPEEPGAGGAAMDDLRERRALLHGCIDEAFRASRASDAKWARFERLDRAGRALDVWRRDLAGVAGGEGTYRDATLSRDDLLRVAEDPAQPPLRRVGAAVALAGARDVGTAKRVRAAANACLDDDLRRALDAAAEGEVLEAELARVEGRRA
ncbi:MAG TPA: hypothetical protein VHB21_22290, partial [Minicystis sp.]|nr:hypothetical protein [Minicystis sp.]